MMSLLRNRKLLCRWLFLGLCSRAEFPRCVGSRRFQLGIDLNLRAEKASQIGLQLDDEQIPLYMTRLCSPAQQGPGSLFMFYDLSVSAYRLQRRHYIAPTPTLLAGRSCVDSNPQGYSRSCNSP